MLLKAKMLILKVTVFFIYNNGKKKKKRQFLKGMSVGYSSRHFNKKMNGVCGLLTEL